MSELEQLRKEVNELRERLAKLEDRKERLEQVEWSKFRKEMDALKQLPQPATQQRPVWIDGPQIVPLDMAKHFPPGTVLC